MKFSFDIKNDKVKQYDRIAFLIAFIQFVIFGIISIYSPDKETRIFATVIAIMLAIAIGIHFYLKSARHHRTIFLNGVLLLTILGWILIGNWLAGLVSLALGLLYHLAKKQMIINFYPDKIEINTYYRKMIRWDQLSNVILKDGLLTIDFRNNRMIQAEIVNSSSNTNEKDFNEFCSHQLVSGAATA